MSKEKESTTFTYKPFSWSSIITGIPAILVSYHFNESFAWAFLHYLISMPYLIYCLLIGRFADGAFLEIINSYI